MRATVKDVAKLAGVSPKTVSNVINGVVFVRPETRARVEQAVSELDYVPNMSARGLRNGRSGMIGLALPDLLRPYSAEITHLVVELAHKRGWGVQIEQTAAEPEREFELLSKARAHLVDGLILNPINLDDSAVMTAGPLPPVVLIGDVDQDVVSQVAIDNVGAAKDMVRHLLDQGCRRIAAVGTPESPSGSSGAGALGGSAGVTGTAAARLRTTGYHEALAEAGIARRPRVGDRPGSLEPGRREPRGQPLPGRPRAAGRVLLLHRLDSRRRTLGTVDSRHRRTGYLPGRRLRQHPREPVRRTAADHRRFRPARLRPVGPGSAR